MDRTQEEGSRRLSSKVVRMVVFCILGILLNAVGSQLAVVLRLPIYLDSLGTVLASMMGGYVPGVIIGYATNIFNGILDSVSFYYGIINVVTALCVAYWAERGWFKRLSRTLLSIPLLAVLTGALSSVLSYYLNGKDLGGELSAPFARELFATGKLGLLTSQVLAELFVSFIDKAFVILLATLLYHMFSESSVVKSDFKLWQQVPLTARELKATMSAKPRRISLSAKVIGVVATIVSFAAVATIMFSYMTFHRSTIEAEGVKAEGITMLMKDVVDPEMVSTYLELGEDAPGYLETEAKLASIRDSFDNVQYVYVYQIQSDGCHVVLDPDTEEVPGSDPGSVIPFDESFESFLPELLAGKEIEPVVSDDTYGWLLTVYTPLRDRMGETVCYLAVDVSMEHLVADEQSFLAGIIALFAAFFILVCTIVLWMSRYSVIIPINSISHASNSFVFNDESIRAESLGPIEALGIHTGDEIENLYNAVKQMSEEAVEYIGEAHEKSETIARMQSNLIMVMADLVESRDKYTGDHVRNTATYARIIMNQMRREGIFPDVLTNEFMSNVYQSAPLHDIGKIVVSDTILNKPGRLTEEEFAIMKSHTLAGQEILESAKSAVSESSYLDEAQRLAAYHHEKWDGSGYPYGLAGEEIPLSARIMAVADVFDALVSKRSYKAGFPIEKAFAIIEEGIGTHFDPQVARAFLHARDKARIVAEKSNLKKQLEEEAAQKRTSDDSSDAHKAPTNEAS
ncbi:MAG: HD domain-containing protein [Atopobiaceae bacterium]|nr:HD domain-containing protein [Atopobiaceae bacterium]